MSLDPELGPAHTEHAARPAPVPVRYNAARHANHVDESPELLRWRADMLMDEMMLGGVDVSAADSVAPRAGERAGERDGSRFDPGYGQPPVAEPPRSEPERRESPTYPSPSTNRPVELSPASPAPRIAPPHQNGDERHGDEIAANSAANSDEAHANGDYRNGSASGEHRRPSAPARQEPTSYRQERADAAASLPPRDVETRHDVETRREPPGGRSEPKRNPEPRPSVRPTPPPVDAHTQWAQSSEKWDWQDFSGQELVPEDDIPAPFTEYRPQERASSAVRQDSADFVNAMAVVGGKRRSTLLPRMSNLDPEALNREIAELHGAIAALLPVGHETGERARHLLDKAYSILQSDPLRSAEVEYYMQQVRTIVQRLRQTRTWSDLYRDRLRVYLLSWLAFSAIVFAARYLFETQMIAAATEWLGSGLLPHWAPFWGAAAAGALGGAAGAIYTMHLHAASGDSFFDRKYGLRGLMLPIIGLIMGGLGYLLFGGTYELAGVNPATNGIAGTLPALAALIFGVSQESIYGTRG